ncbi:amidohydrolase family protein, partial [Bacteroidota bacterium]
NFPKAPDVKDPYDALNISLKNLKHWELAPKNTSFLQDNEITFALTSSGIKNKSDFWKNLQTAIDCGLDKKTALKALTYTPAKLLNADSEVGSLKTGMLANFLITSGNLFEKDVVIYENWIQGKKFLLKEMNITDYSGKYDLYFGKDKYSIEISGKPEKPVIKLVIDSKTSINTKSSIKNGLISVSFNPDQKNKKKGDIRLSGWIDDKSMKGSGQLADGSWITWSAEYKSKLKESKKKSASSKEKDKQVYGKVVYPFMAYGMEELPEAKDILIKNATVWTSENQGILENTDVLIRNGKIAKIGKNLNEKNVINIDGTGKHLASGIIDEHSHIAGSGGLNEGSHAVTPEVRVGDVMNPEDISIYRQLAGGVTAAQCLHGSANPIGGQSQIMKHRWGRSPEEMKVKNTVGFVKHALGENVKQSRTPAWLATRFPQTRMGVEQTIKDAYIMAQDYKKKWDNYNNLPDNLKTAGKKPRKDMRMEALVDVLEKRSFITCHTYVQSETNMIMKLAEEFGIIAHTLIHNTEGYKLADKMKEHGAMGSLLPDWWAYKWEVYHAIPYNAALNLQVGLVTCIHSDNADVAARLNLEAAKAVKYGNVSEEEAWKLVTLNPAKILHIDNRTGSIKQGKDADLVLWSDNPLSVYAKAEITMVDGIIYYDYKKNEELMEANNKEKTRLVNKILNEKPADLSAGMPSKK